jgi:Flagellar hook capping protein - N-terminal region
MSTTPITPTPPSTGGNSTTNTGLPTAQGLNNMFLQLLVAQLQNQNPLSPLDPSQFVGQLAQFSELSEVTQIQQLLQQTLGGSSGSGTSGAGNSSAPNNTASPAPQNSIARPSPMLSSAASAAQAALPNFVSPSASLLNRQIQGVF